jgi:hypothetical protein
VVNAPATKESAVSPAGDVVNAPAAKGGDAGPPGDAVNGPVAAVATGSRGAQAYNISVSEAMRRMWEGQAPTIATAARVGEVRPVNY